MFSEPEIPDSVYIQKNLTQLHIDEWLKDDVFQFRWWMLLGMILLSLLVWYILLDKTKLKGVCLFTVISVISILTIFECGDELILWDYPTDVIPIFPPLSSINLFIVPLVFSIIYQRFISAKGFLWATLAAAAIICFIIEPLLSWGGFYELINWQYYFSFPVYVALALIIRFITVKVVTITEKSRIIL